MKGLILLTSTGFRNPAVAQEIEDHFAAAETTGILKVALVTTAAEHKEKSPFVLRQKGFIEKQLRASVEMVDIETGAVNLDPYDIVYIVGGNTFHLIKCARTVDMKETLQRFLAQNKVVVGASAGALILGPDISIAAEVNPDDRIEDTLNYEGLGLVDQIIYPHYESDVENQLRSFEQAHGLVVERLDNEGYLAVIPEHS